MGLKKEEIFKIISSTHKEESPQTLKEVAYNLALASTTTSNLAERAARAVEKLRNQEKPHAPLTQAAVKQESNSLSICPICKFKMKTVKLLEDRSAFYCQDHKIVVPFPAIDELEADV